MIELQTMRGHGMKGFQEMMAIQEYQHTPFILPVPIRLYRVETQTSHFTQTALATTVFHSSPWSGQTRTVSVKEPSVMKRGYRCEACAYSFRIRKGSVVLYRLPYKKDITLESPFRRERRRAVQNRTLWSIEKDLPRHN